LTRLSRNVGAAIATHSPSTESEKGVSDAGSGYSRFQRQADVGPHLIVAAPRSRQLNRSHLNVAHKIAILPATEAPCCGRIFCIPEQFPTIEAMPPRVERRKISINLFHLTHHEFGSAMDGRFQIV
jgi:hypothetical protein